MASLYSRAPRPFASVVFRLPTPLRHRNTRSLRIRSKDGPEKDRKDTLGGGSRFLSPDVKPPSLSVLVQVCAAGRPIEPDSSLSTVVRRVVSCFAGLTERQSDRDRWIILQRGLPLTLARLAGLAAGAVLALLPALFHPLECEVVPLVDARQPALNLLDPTEASRF